MRLTLSFHRSVSSTPTVRAISFCSTSAKRSADLFLSHAVFGANFDKVSATAYYPTKPNTAFGGGSLSNFKIDKNSKWALPSISPPRAQS